eukprot:TRINITY_DN17515_c1_g1_i1.p1 TRINITY_DN17515_c1_g1~~TRINITY_DN17515_c1_g1_i1.p1  ORF type:complete len:189 (+),score=57.24 TRINITY_DN17515_c1_g1_i1:54-620(+)
MIQKILPLLGLAVWEEGSPAFNGSSGAVWGGADVVEYWSLDAGAAGVYGTADHSREYGGYTFYFKDLVNAEKFSDSPDDFIPTWGGFDAWSLSNENHWRADLMGPPCNPTDSWFIYNSSLYCTLSPYLRTLFLKSANVSIGIGNDKWIGFYGSLDAGPINNGCFQTTIAQCQAGNITFHNRNNSARTL